MQKLQLQGKSDRFNPNARFQPIPQVACDYSVSENTIRRYAKECGAIRRLGRSVRIDRKKFDECMDILTAAAE